MTSCATIILAAGKGTRMRSSMPKVLHKIAGRSLLGHVLTTSNKLGAEKTVIVVGPDMEDVASEGKKYCEHADIAVQTSQSGTGDAVKSAFDALGDYQGPVLILYADTPLLPLSVLESMLKGLESADIAVLGFQSDTPTGYGRLVSEAGQLTGIVEELDATDAQKQIDICNSGVIGTKAGHLTRLVSQITPNNAKGEYYLTDMIGLGHEDGLKNIYVLCEEEDVLGINDREQLSQAEQIAQNRLRSEFMRAGVTMIDPNSVTLSADSSIGQDVTIEPHVVIGEGVSIGDNVTILGFSHMENTTIENGANIGPYARLRPGTHIGVGAKIGNFVETKNTHVAEGAKINHLSYAGDADIGKNANIGAGTITCNYDGTSKHKTVIGEGCFVGSNSSLVAPVSLGDGAYIGSGSVITKDVGEGDLAISRVKQVNKQGLAAKLKSRKT